MPPIVPFNARAQLPISDRDIHTGNESEITDKICSTIFKSSLFNDVHEVYSVGRGGQNKCLAKKHNARDSETIEYRISPAYILDSLLGRKGRFVIQDGAAIAIAEQPATVSVYNGRMDIFGNGKQLSTYTFPEL